MRKRNPDLDENMDIFRCPRFLIRKPNEYVAVLAWSPKSPTNPSSVRSNHDYWDEIKDWCDTTGIGSYYGIGLVELQGDEQRTAFILRWA